MKRMPNGGYTIIEVMIFLLISSALLGSATTMISGKQERTLFTQTVTTFDQKLKDILNDVSTGYYPTDESFGCRLIGAGPTEQIDFSGVREQGTNTGCLFLGRATEFVWPGRHYDTYTLVGSQNGTNLATARAKLLGDPGPPSNPGVILKNSLEVDVEVVRVVSKTDTSRNVRGIAMISEFSETSALTGEVTGNAGRITLYEVLDDFLNNAGQPGPTQMRPATQGVILCLQQGGLSDINGRKAAIIIGGNQQQLSTETKIDGWPPEC